MLAAMFAFAIMDALMKELAVRQTPFQVAFLRCFASLVLIGAVVAAKGSWGELRASKWRWHFIRGISGIVMLVSFVYGAHRLTLAKTYSLYLTAPLVITALSVPIFRDRVPLQRWLAILVGLMGVVIILKPWTGGAFAPDAAIAMGLATLSYAISALIVRSLGPTHSNLSLVFWYLLLIAIGCGILAVPDWTPLEPMDWWSLLGIGIAGALGQFWLTAAFSGAPASVVTPFEYTGILWAMAIDQVFWSATPPLHLIVGAFIVIASGYFVIHEERRGEVTSP